MPQYRETIESLHTALNGFCPSGVEQRRLAKIRKNYPPAEQAAEMLRFVLTAYDMGDWGAAWEVHSVP